jgi:hypothetical protein
MHPTVSSYIVGVILFPHPMKLIVFLLGLWVVGILVLGGPEEQQQQQLTDNEMLLKMSTPDRLATIEQYCDTMVSEIVQTARAALFNNTKPGVTYFVVNLYEPTWRCGGNERDQLERVTRRLCGPPHNFFVTCDQTDIATNPVPNGAPGQTVRSIPMRLAMRGENNHSPCDCKAEPIDPDRGLPGHAAAKRKAQEEEAARIHDQVTKVSPPPAHVKTQ